MKDNHVMRRLIKRMTAMSKKIGKINHPYKESPLDGIDVKKEYELIKQKKCTLSSGLRQMIVIVVENKIKY